MSGPNQSFTADDVVYTGFDEDIDLGFTPKVVFMMGASVPNSAIGTTFYNEAYAGLGWCRDPAFEQTSVGSGGFQNGAIPGGSYISESVFAGIFENTNARSKQIDMISFDCDTSGSHIESGYTIHPASTLQTQAIPTIALGGNNIRVANGSFSWPGAAGNVVITGCGFQPELVMFLWSKTPSYNYPFNPTANGSSFGFGAGSSSSSSEQFALYTVSQGGNTGQASHLTGNVIVAHAGSPFPARATLASMDVDGFTLTFNSAANDETTGVFPRLIGWIALADTVGGFKVGTATVPGSTGNVAYTGCGFAPDQVILASGNVDTPNVLKVNCGSFGLGMFDDTLERSILSGEVLVAAPNFSARRMNTTALALGASGTATVDAEASRASMDPDGFTLNWTNVAAPGKPFGWIAMHTTGTNEPCGPGTFLPQIYRWLKK